MKDERYRASVRWTLATASDQAPAGARVESLQVHQNKKHASACFLFCTEEGIRRTSGTEQVSGGHLRPRATKATRSPRIKSFCPCQRKIAKNLDISRFWRSFSFHQKSKESSKKIVGFKKTASKFASKRLFFINLRQNLRQFFGAFLGSRSTLQQRLKW